MQTDKGCYTVVHSHRLSMRWCLRQQPKSLLLMTRAQSYLRLSGFDLAHSCELNGGNRPYRRSSADRFIYFPPFCPSFSPGLAQLVAQCCEQISSRKFHFRRQSSIAWLQLFRVRNTASVSYESIGCKNPTAFAVQTRDQS